MLTGFNWSCISKKSLIDPGFGSYTVEVGTDGALRLTSRSSPSVVYWSWPPGKLGELVQPLNALMDSDPRTEGLVKFTYQDNKEEVYLSYTIMDESASVSFLIDISGQLKMNIWSQSAESWQTVHAEPSDFCITPAVCGPFTVCNSNSDPLFCDCMETFSRRSLQDWELGDRTGGCARNTPIDCITINRSTASSTDVFHPVAHVTLPYDPRRIEDATMQSNCAEACLNDCSCTAYAYSNSMSSVWHGELLNVKQNDGNAITSQDVLYIRLAARDLQSFRKAIKSKPGVIAVACIVSSGFLLLFMLLLIIWRNRLKSRDAPVHNSGGNGGGIIAFRYNDLCRATKKFSERLGGGGFGSVFKGALSDSTTIEVKRLDGARQGEKQFRAEMSSIGMIQHINLVKLIGFCCGGDKRLLVYEHMPNGSLDGHLFKSDNAPVLSWSTRYQIAIGVARGLLYLHKCYHKCIIHCDIKPENILLDASFVPKIADFGMAAFVGRDFSRVLTTFKGVAITPKVDVYSFGMVLMEIISGRRNSPEVCTSNGYHVAYFPVQAILKLHEGDVQSLVDPQLHGYFNLEEVERICKVACWCIQDNELDRPEIGEVVQVLEGLQELEMPPMPRLLAAIVERSDEASM
ncbi:G-type lectin S-receptor-like serine/threonine-protein kinase [Panicum miliaceum]|uniref:G-type lectin S-receptor-like serine/threonine-protein kinase n=1 Tax=Panicum miliaceum TaxID=4540 RepID=A0A3L6QUJ7_PANMI|nr:G-type lectin S-receptor-like serine/threonine-protein kinase [Panicum miliaceum]